MAEFVVPKVDTKHIGEVKLEPAFQSVLQLDKPHVTKTPHGARVYQAITGGRIHSAITKLFDELRVSGRNAARVAVRSIALFRGLLAPAPQGRRALHALQVRWTLFGDLYRSCRPST